jgi:hypothetical protein
VAYIYEKDVLCGKSGRIIATISGRNIELAVVKKVEAKYELNEADMPVVGTTLVQKKTTGMSLSGSMTLYYGTPEFKQLILNYQNTGALPYFRLVIENDDPTTSVGKQTITLHNVKITSGILALLDAEAEFLEEELEFSYTKFTIDNEFIAPLEVGS